MNKRIIHLYTFAARMKDFDCEVSVTVFSSDVV